MSGQAPRGSLLTFVELEFSHAIGPLPAAYLVEMGEGDGLGAEMPLDADGLLDDDPSPTAGAALDVLVVRVDEAPRARPKRRRGGAVPSDGSGPVSITVATHVRASAPWSGGDEARQTLDAWSQSAAEQQRLVGEAVAVINRAIRAHRVAVGDPYSVEVTAQDARAARIGFGTGGQLRHGNCTESFTCLGSGTGPDSGGIDSRSFVAAVLGGNALVYLSDDLLLRLLLDRQHGRRRAAAMQVRAGVDLLVEELRARGHAKLSHVVAAAAPRAERLYDRAVDDALDKSDDAELDELVRVLEDALDQAREDSPPA